MRGRVSWRWRLGDWLQDEIVSWRRTGIDVVSLLTPDEADLGFTAERLDAETQGLDFKSFPKRRLIDHYEAISESVR